MRRVFLLAVGSSLTLTISTATAQQTALADSELMAKLKDAAPPEVVKEAAILTMGADGQMQTVREGKTGWTCMDPGGSPMCADKGGMEWVHAWQSKGPAPQKLGFIYMLAGDAGTSNTDPYPLQETPDNNWVKSGPHVMIVGAEAKAMLQNYPRQAKADPTKPWVMWAGTPYLMLPVK